MLAIIVAISPVSLFFIKRVTLGTLMARQHYQNMVTLTRSLAKKWPQATMLQQVKEGTHWQALVELTWSSTSDIPQWSIIGKTVPPWLDCTESTPKSWPIAQPGKDGEDEENGKSDHCNFSSTKKAESPSICSPYSSLQIFLVNQKLKYIAVNYNLLRCYCEYDMGFPDTPRNSPLSGWRQQEIEHLAIHRNSVKDKAMTEQRHCRSICILPQNGIVELTISANLHHTDNFLLPINCLVTVIISWSGGWHFLTCDLSLRL